MGRRRKEERENERREKKERRGKGHWVSMKGRKIFFLIKVRNWRPPSMIFVLKYMGIPIETLTHPPDF